MERTLWTDERLTERFDRIDQRLDRVELEIRELRLELHNLTLAFIGAFAAQFAALVVIALQV